MVSPSFALEFSWSFRTNALNHYVAFNFHDTQHCSASPLPFCDLSYRFYRVFGAIDCNRSLVERLAVYRNAECRKVKDLTLIFLD